MEKKKLKRNRKQLPIFPLGVVLLPEMIMPLHIFEERYKTMITECLERNEPFGIVYFDGKQINKVGCTAHIVKVTKQYGDGRMDILIHGEQRFYMDHIDDSHVYLMSGIIYIDDVEESLTDEDEALFNKAADLVRALHELYGSSEQSTLLDRADLVRLSFIVPSAEGFTMEERQRFLEMISSRERLEKGLTLLDQVIARMKINQEIMEIIGGNGHIRAYLAEKGLRHDS
jgi:ATP-dependent Lon protease